MSLFQLADEHIRSNESAIEFLRQRGILRAVDRPSTSLSFVRARKSRLLDAYTCYNVVSIICYIFFILVKVDIFVVKVGISWNRSRISKK